MPATGSAEAARRVVQLVTDSIPRALGIDPGSRAGGDAGAPRTGRHDRAEQGAEGGAQPRAPARCGASTPATGSSPPPTTSSSSRPASPTARSAWSRAPATARSTSPSPPGRSRSPGKALSDLRHGWAITVHRAQGSEWPGVVVVAAAGGRGHAVAAAGLHGADPGAAAPVDRARQRRRPWPGRSARSTSARGAPGWPSCWPRPPADLLPCRRPPRTTRRGRRPRGMRRGRRRRCADGDLGPRGPPPPQVRGPTAVVRCDLRPCARRGGLAVR